jgi:hypothetical protein
LSLTLLSCVSAKLKKIKQELDSLRKEVAGAKGQSEAIDRLTKDLHTLSQRIATAEQGRTYRGSRSRYGVGWYRYGCVGSIYTRISVSIGEGTKDLHTLSQRIATAEQARTYRGSRSRYGVG